MKDYQSYLDAANGDHEKAGRAAARDAQSASESLTRVTGERDTARSEASTAKASLSDAQNTASSAKSDADSARAQNAGARRFQRLYKDTIAALKLPVDDLSDEAAVSEKASKAIADLQASSPRVEALSKAMTDLGGNPDDLENSVKALQGRLARADKADTLERSQAIRDAAETLGYDHVKLSRLSGIDALTQQDVSTEKDGQRVITKVWGVPGKDDAGQDTFTPLKDFASPFDASLRTQQTPGRQWTPAQTPTGRDAPANPIASALNPGSASADKPRVHNALTPNPTN